MGDRLLILGASARAAAASARRAGLEPFAIDLFADRDTQLLGDCLRCPPDEYPEGLFRLARQVPPMPWMYTGGLENYPELIGELAKERELWGNGPDVLRRVRDPFALSNLLSANGHAHPRVLPATGPLPDEGSWLRKPLRGSAGFGIGHARRSDRTSTRHFYQEFVVGQPMSMVFVSRVGLVPTRQLVGMPWLHAAPFRYAGSIGPVDYSTLDMQDVSRSGFRLATHAGMKGLFGIDFVHDEQRDHVIEVNPRYPASVEVIEHAGGIAVVSRHQLAFGRGQYQPALLKPTCVVGKAIYYADRPITFPAEGPWDDSLAHVTDVWRRPDFADIPHPGDVIDAGHPVLTFFTEADSEEVCLRRLQLRAAELDRLFGVSP